MEYASGSYDFVVVGAGTAECVLAARLSEKGEGVRYIFGNPETTELPLMDALVDAPALQYILALQEASAVAMADR